MKRTGQGLVEYALLLGLIAVLAIAGMLWLGTHIRGTLSNVGTNLGPVPGLVTPVPSPCDNGNGHGNDPGNGHGNCNGH